MKPLLLVVDVQNGFFGDDNPNLPAFYDAVEVINSAIALFRAQNLPIAFVQHISARKVPGTPAYALYDKLDYHPDDPKVSKRHHDAFWQTDLHDVLQQLQADYAVVVGFYAEFCVLSSYRGALARGYEAAILQGATASLDSQRTQFTLDICNTITFGELREQLATRRELDKLNIVYITTENADEAAHIGKALVESRLAACVNIVDGMSSMYWWEGAVQSDAETILIAKTRAALVPALTAKVKELHSYDCPCVIALPIVAGHEEYLQWLWDETT